MLFDQNKLKSSWNNSAAAMWSSGVLKNEDLPAFVKYLQSVYVLYLVGPERTCVWHPKPIKSKCHVF